MKLSIITFIFIFILSILLIFISVFVDQNTFLNFNFVPLKQSKIKRSRYDVDCDLIVKNELNETKKAKKILYELKTWLKKDKIPLIDDQNYIFHLSECNLYKSLRNYNDLDGYIDRLEFNFPIAFIINVEQQAEQFERLFRSIYRSHNFYCVHVDLKSSFLLKKAIQSIASCFPNVIIADSEFLVQGEFSMLKYQLNCMNDLVNLKGFDKRLAKIKWKYLINLKSDDFLLIHNYDLVKLFMFYNGANEIQILNGANFSSHYEYVHKVSENKHEIIKTDKKKSNPPHGYKIMKGLFNYAISREFTEYILTNSKVNDLILWMNDTYESNELFIPTVQFNLQFNPPGGFKTELNIKQPQIIRDSLMTITKNKSCDKFSMASNFSCIILTEDLKYFTSAPNFLAHKLDLEDDPIAYQCLEDWLDTKMKERRLIDLNRYCKYISKFSNITNCHYLI